MAGVHNRLSEGSHDQCRATSYGVAYASHVSRRFHNVLHQELRPAEQGSLEQEVQPPMARELLVVGWRQRSCSRDEGWELNRDYLYMLGRLVIKLGHDTHPLLLAHHFLVSNYSY
jgi:hypothetical protein